MAVSINLSAQLDPEDPIDGRVNTVFTSVPFLRISPDGRAGGMGDLGVASSPDAAAVYWNASKLAFAEEDLEFSFTYTPWLRNIVDDMFLGYATGYKNIDEFQTVGASIRYFSLGEIVFRDINRIEQGRFTPNEFAIDFAYARKMSEAVSLGINMKYFYSNLAKGQTVDGNLINAANGVAADISMFYTKPNANGGDFNFGAAITNIGTKVSYSENFATRDFIPVNLGIGAGYSFELDEYNKLAIYGEVNKLLVPSPIQDTDLNNDGQIDPEFDENNNQIVDFREASLLDGIFNSFSDAPEGGKEELRELMLSIGAEYTYNEQFMLRFGHFNEHQLKGDRKYLTFGFGLNYTVFGLNFSYLVPISQTSNHPLQNTLRFALNWRLDSDGGSSE